MMCHFCAPLNILQGFDDLRLFDGLVKAFGFDPTPMPDHAITARRPWVGVEALESTQLLPVVRVGSC